MTYKSIELLCSDSTPLRKRWEDYRSVISAYLALKKAASLCRHPTNVGPEKAMCTEQVELAQSHLAMVRIDLNALQERHGSVIQRITDLEETLCLTRKRSVS